KPAQLCVVTITQMCPILQWRSGIENTQPNFKCDQRNENGTTQQCELQAPPPTRLAGFSQAGLSRRVLALISTAQNRHLSSKTSHCACTRQNFARVADSGSEIFCGSFV